MIESLREKKTKETNSYEPNSANKLITAEANFTLQLTWDSSSYRSPQLHCKVCLKSASLYEFLGRFWLVLWCVVWRPVTIEKMPHLWWSVWARKTGQHFPGIIPRLVTHSYEAFTYNTFICLLSANKNSSVDLLELAVTRGFRLVRHSADKVLTNFGRDENS